jgi:uncharacterized SAM-binding protein YcdF (DUF218 family)
MSQLDTTETPSGTRRMIVNPNDNRSLKTDDLIKSRTGSLQKFCGILVRKERWGLSWGGRLLVTSLALLTAYVAILNVYPFLAVTHRVKTNVLVVEGWIQRYAIREGAEEFNKGSYERIFTTGGPENGSGGYINDYQTSASVGADALKKCGIPDDHIQMVPSRIIGRDRTYSSAIALRDWFHEHNHDVRSINVVTEDAHARRTRLLYEKAFGKDVNVGIIALPNPDFDPSHWWHSSEGVREVIGESIAYIYARLFFYPSEQSHDKEAAKTLQSGTRQ